jgi:uncharacterized protein
LWTLFEIKQQLDTAVSEIFIYRYGLTTDGNFFDPHTRETGKNVLVQAHSLEETAARFQKTVDETHALLEAAEKKLFEIRSHRPRPHRDEKILTEWNGLMISALAQAAIKLEDPSYLEAADKAARFLYDNLYDLSSKKLYRSWCDGKSSVEAQQADYAMLIEGLLDLHEAEKNNRWLEWAEELAASQEALFFDPELGGYFMNVPREDVLIRLKDDHDNVTPSGNSIAVWNGLRLSKRTGKPVFAENARRTLDAFGPKLERNPASLAVMAAALSQL